LVDPKGSLIASDVTWPPSGCQSAEGKRWVARSTWYQAAPWTGLHETLTVSVVCVVVFVIANAFIAAGAGRLLTVMTACPVPTPLHPAPAVKLVTL
jgi:hypothetical protein